MSRLTELVTRLERASKNLGMELEAAVSILEGGHPTHKVIVNPTTVAATTNPTVPAATSISKKPTDTTASMPSASTVGMQLSSDSIDDLLGTKENPTSSGIAGASGAVASPPVAGSIAPASVETAAQNQAAAQSEV
jgi:hypothetical protein